MHTFFKRFTALAASAVMSVCAFSDYSVFAEESATVKTEVKVSFDFSDPDVKPFVNKDGSVDVIEDIITTPNSSVFLPDGKVQKEGCTFSAWSADGVYAYEPGDIFRVGTEDVVLKPIFYESADKEYFNLVYSVDINGEPYDVSELLPAVKKKKNRLVVPSLTAIQNNDARQIGWTDGEHNFLPEQKFIMPAKDVVLKPIWHYYHSLKYVAGDVDGIIGAHYADFILQEGGEKNLAEYDRFARKGYEITGWLCDYDNKVYEHYYPYVMPDADVVFSAVWKPINYNVVFKTGITGVASLKVKGETGTEITVPELDAQREGYTFGGWYKEAECTTPWDFANNTVTANITLYAMWTENTTVDSQQGTVDTNEQQNSGTDVGSVMSEGSLWIVIAVAVAAAGGVTAIVITKKKKPEERVES